MARVALYLPNLLGGGAERVMLNLARGLTSLGHEVDLVLASVSGPYADAIPEVVRVVDLGGRRTLASLPALAAYLRRERPTALVSAINHANLVAVWAAALARFHGAVAVTEHNELAPRERSLWQRSFNAAIRLSYPRADAVVAVSHGVKASLVAHAGVAEASVQVIYNPVIGTSLEPTRRPRPEELPSDGVPLLVGMGRLTSQKNFANLLRAFSQLRKQRQARLLILGEGEERPRLEALARQLGIEADVTLPGFVPNPYDYLAHADLFVLSSDREGLPTVLIEALAVGTPAVATDCRSGPREILADGAYGALVAVGDSAALAEAIGAALDAPPPTAPVAWLEQFAEVPAARRYLRALGLPDEGARSRQAASVPTSSS